ncbi:hypothetical protein B484DRAFT_405388 [Ochromonadaceae sp. CCMP2298]|nr:hypothetical protein B484DRAFT_405388 [Ochromonadaceae sp. CCMP2298]
MCYVLCIADVLESVLAPLRLDPALVHVISNRCIFEGEVLSAFVEPHLHVFNKRCTPYLHTPFFALPSVAHGQTVLLLGDSMGDVTMCEGMDRQCILKPPSWGCGWGWGWDRDRDRDCGGGGG